MKLPKIAINNYQFVAILVLLAAFVGVNAFLTMPRSEDPSPDFPNYTVIAVYPGTGPEDMEELVVDPLEEAIEEVDDLKKMRMGWPSSTLRDILASIPMSNLMNCKPRSTTYAMSYRKAYIALM